MTKLWGDFFVAKVHSCSVIIITVYFCRFHDEDITRMAPKGSAIVVHVGQMNVECPAGGFVEN